ncbi:glycosyltransferase, partial [Candidatus Saccharibacteria bacterium]|nr:glycosyltransferase [Candidatus Saccharibacteria bacterium]
MISVAMATYNGEKYIQEQLLSILPQIGKGDEIIISDDGSTDSTLEIIRKINDKRIKIIQGPK